MKTLLQILDLENEPDIITKIIDAKMKRKLFHLTIKATGEHKYYGSLTAVFLDNKHLNVSKFTLDRHDFTNPFENEVCKISKCIISSAGDIRKTALK